MRTVLTKSPAEAAEFIKNGGIVAFPTETVYGLGANVFDEQAVGKIFEAKRRPPDNPLIVHIAELEQVAFLASVTNRNARKLIEAFFPGPLTVVLPKSKSIPMIATAGLESVGVRMPRADLAREFLSLCGVPVAAPSANLSGRPSPTTWKAVYEDLNGRVDCILQGDATEIGLESTVVDCTADEPVLLRTGAISLVELQAVVPETRLYTADDSRPKSPGLKHRHYTPGARVYLVEEDEIRIDDAERAAFIGLEKPKVEFELVKICRSVEDYAHALFEFFRECDREKVGAIYCEAVEEKGIGAALMDRLRRAASA